MQIEECTSERLHKRAAELIVRADTVLDIGCGIRPQQFVSPRQLICVEPCAEYVAVLGHILAGSNAIVIPIDALTALQAMPNRSVDSIFMLDVIEHMSEELGRQVIHECERVARKQIVVYTPLGFMPQEIHAGERDAWNLHGGDFQQHKSGWMPNDFPGFQSLVCPDLHRFNFKGEPVVPPFGGFYAIKTVDDASNSLDPRLEPLRADIERHLSGPFHDAVSYHLAKLDLEAGIRTCQHLSEILIAEGLHRPLDELLGRATSWKNEAKAVRSIEFSDYLTAWIDSMHKLSGNPAEAARLVDLGLREKELTRLRDHCDVREVALAEHEVNINAFDADVRRRETWVAKKESDLAGHEANVDAFHADVQRRETWVAKKESDLAGHEANVEALRADVQRREAWVAKKESDLAGHEANVEALRADVQRREAWVAKKESDLAGHEANVEALRADVQRREAWVAKKESDLAGHEPNFDSESQPRDLDRKER